MDQYNVVICFLTFKRTNYALQAIESVRKALDHPAREWYIADAGSPPAHREALLKALRGEQIIGAHWGSVEGGPALMPGANWNRALKAAHERCPYVLMLEDDWVIRRPIDLRMYINLLMNNPEVGIVRLGNLAKGSRLHVAAYDGQHYLRFDRSSQYAFSGNPHLRHRRFTEAYGYYSEELGPGDTELEYDGRFRAEPGPEIVWHVGADGWGWFGHIGAEKSYDG